MDSFFTIEGIASTESEDSYGEIIRQQGIDLSWVSDGLVTINIEHGDGFPIEEMSVVGVLTRAEIRETVTSREFCYHLQCSISASKLDSCGGWWPTPETAVRSFCVVVNPPPFDDYFGLEQRVKDLAV